MAVRCCAAFGPNGSYFFNSPTKWSRNGLPASVNELFTQKQPAKEVFELALAPDGSFLIAYRKANVRNGIPTGLENWLIKNNTVVRDLTSLSVTLGPNNSYFALDDKGSAWGNLPPSLDKIIADRLDSKGHWKTGKNPLSVTLGPNGSFVFIDVSGGANFSSNLQQEAPALSQFLRNSKGLNGVFCIMSASAQNTFLLVGTNGNCMCNMPPAGHNAYNGFAADWKQAIQNLNTQNQNTASRNRGSSTSKTTSILRNVNSGLKLLNTVLNAANGNGGGGGSSYSYSNDNTFVPDNSSFWQPIQSAASDPIQ